ADIIEVAKPRDLSSGGVSSSSREYISLSSSSNPNPSVSETPETPEFIPLAVESAAASPNPEAEKKERSRGYYVVIPSRQKDL
ncbi:hypothetical protein R0J87_23035, partial [Halomonas sp. SIMBA_159]